MSLPPGLYYYPNYLSEEQSQSLLDELRFSSKWTGVTSNLKSRKVIQYGYAYSYARAGKPLQPLSEIPARYLEVLKSSKTPEILQDWKPQQLIINRYLPGQGIAAHVDQPDQFGPIIACLTLGSGCVVRFSKVSGDLEPSADLYVEPNSLYIMTQDARYRWRHGIASRTEDEVNDQILPRRTRYSLTYRTCN